MTYITTLVLFLFVCISTGNFLIQSSDSSTKYDITTLLNDSIAKTFLNLDGNNTINELRRNLKNLYSTSYEAEVVYKSSLIQDETYFIGIRTVVFDLELTNIRHELTRDEVTIFSSKLAFEMTAKLGATKDELLVDVHITANFENISIISIKSSDNLQRSQFYINISYDAFDYDNINSNWLSENLKLDLKNELEQTIKSMVPSLFLQTIQRDEKLQRSLDKIFCYHPEKEITSVHSDFPAHKDQYHYFIPNITSFGRTLNNITITGLSNIQSRTFGVLKGLHYTNLTINNIRGMANLYYGTENFTIFSLAFEADSISMLVFPDANFVNMTAYNYSVFQTKLNISLTKHQSKWVMEGIQLAIGSSILPSMKIFVDRNESSSTSSEHPLSRIYNIMSQQYQASKIQDRYLHNWNESIPQSITLQSSLHNYTITLYDVPLIERSPNPYPYYTTCQLYKKLLITYRIFPHFAGKIRLNNSTHEFEEMFAFDLINTHLIKQHNDDSEPSVIIWSKVELLSNDYNFTKYERNEIMNKTHEMLKSAIKETTILYAKPFLSMPSDHCTKPVKMFDDFLPFFADHEIPYYIPNEIANNITPKISNVVISEWTKDSWASFNFYYDDVHENATTFVGLTLGVDGKVQMDLYNTSGHLEKLEMSLANFHFSNDVTGEVISWFIYKSIRTVPNNKFLSENDSGWIEDKLKDIVGKSLNRTIFHKQM